MAVMDQPHVSRHTAPLHALVNIGGCEGGKPAILTANTLVEKCIRDEQKNDPNRSPRPWTQPETGAIFRSPLTYKINYRPLIWARLAAPILSPESFFFRPRGPRPREIRRTLATLPGRRSVAVVELLRSRRGWDEGLAQD